MKKIEAILRPESLDRVRQALQDLHYPGLTVSEVKGHGQQKGQTLVWRGQEYHIDLLPKVKVEIVAMDDDVSRIVTAIVENGKTGETGDGKIFILPVENAVRVRTGEAGESVL